MADVRESQVEAYLVKRVKALGGEIRKVQWVGRRGAPDRFVMLPDAARARLIYRALAGAEYNRNPWVELKRPGLLAEDHQAREHERMRGLGEIVLIVNSFELVDFYFPLGD